ncbi:MAG TPA: GNAT family N-acetyltransferase [Pyrinomonadaceae bacterium]|jgi:ribosomal protein S18 acetylase RimI-like enzyme|nr:GNAT family N-acetyltransferase [Pyrinomonadaceae bacterium]
MTQETTPLIRRATIADADLLAELGARTFREAFAADNKPEDMAAYMAAAFSPEKQAAELGNPRGTFLIAEIGGVAIGYAKLNTGDAPVCVGGSDPIELARLYVSQEWIGRGVGEALMRECIEEARRAGRQTMWLGVWEHNPRAQAFYRKWNFHVVGEHVFQLGSDFQTDLLMERAVRAAEVTSVGGKD